MFAIRILKNVAIYKCLRERKVDKFLILCGILNFRYYSCINFLLLLLLTCIFRHCHSWKKFFCVDFLIAIFLLLKLKYIKY